MPRSIWKGTLSFGLVSVPVKLYSAVVDRSLHFHQLHATDHARIVQRRFCSAEGEEVPYEEIVKGYEVAPGRHVVIDAQEIAALEPAFTGTIEIEDFVQLQEIDPIHLDRPYYLVPGAGGARPYRLLLQAMHDTEKVAIARVVLRSRQHLVAIYPHGEVLRMTTMNFAEEVQRTAELPELHEEEVELGERELEIARSLVEAVVRPFDIAAYHDTYREAVLDLIDRKVGGEQIALEPPARQELLQAPDLMSALEASIEQVRARRERDGAPPARKRAKTAPKAKAAIKSKAAPKESSPRSPATTGARKKART
jgi:DNA end-binding protein Ku